MLHCASDNENQNYSQFEQLVYCYPSVIILLIKNEICNVFRTENVNYSIGLQNVYQLEIAMVYRHN